MSAAHSNQEQVARLIASRCMYGSHLEAFDAWKAGDLADFTMDLAYAILSTDLAQHDFVISPRNDDARFVAENVTFSHRIQFEDWPKGAEVTVTGCEFAAAQIHERENGRA